MRFIRLQQKYGFKKKGKGTPRHKQAPTTDNEEVTTEKDATPTKESDVAEEGANEDEATEDEATENWGTRTHWPQLWN
jgi:hypothetical protein